LEPLTLGLLSGFIGYLYFRRTGVSAFIIPAAVGGVWLGNLLVIMWGSSLLVDLGAGTGFLVRASHIAIPGIALILTVYFVDRLTRTSIQLPAESPQKT
jgi:hypothetical protein